MSGKLFIVPTPIGNLEDMTPRGISTLKASDMILAEDTRTSGVLMRHFGIKTPMASHHKFNEHQTVAAVVEKILAGQTMSLVTDAGTPGISDPGFLLVRECRKAGIEVETLPGATALIPALVNSGLPCERFCFEGFLPAKKGRKSRLEEIASETRTVVIYESPLRLAKTLEQLAQVCGSDREASVSREISKIHDTTLGGTLGTLAQYFKENPAKGEIAIVVAGKKPLEGEKSHKNKYRQQNMDQIQ